MSAPLRIYPHENQAADLGPGKKEPRSDDLKNYTERLVKLIPAEVVGLYLAGRTAINTKFPSGSGSDPNALLSEPWAWLIWGAFCLAVVFFVRRWATSDKARKVPPEAGAVSLAMISFAIWVYSFGDVFRVLFHVWDPLIATFFVLGWTFIVPAYYGRKP